MEVDEALEWEKKFGSNTLKRVKTLGVIIDKNLC